MNPIIGLEGLVTAELQTDTASALTYKAVEEIEGLVEVAMEDISGDAKPFYADNVEKGRVNAQAKVRLRITLLAAAKKTLADIYGQTLSEDGERILKDTDKPPYRAIGFKADDHGDNQDGLWVKKCIPTKRTNGQTYRTIEGETVTVQTVEVEFEGIPTVYDKEYMRECNSGDTGMATKWATWFDNVPGATTP